MSEQALTEISFDVINELTDLKEHQEFLLKLLTNKDSFIRKRIIDQNLSYLNLRLSEYLDKLGLPHQVKFINDLSVEISLLGNDLDWDGLSRGERTRLILALSWAFRDIFENNTHAINLVFVDELLDSGMAGDNVGLLLRGIEKNDVERGQVVAKPGSIKPHKKFKGEVYVLSKDEGGRHTPFFKGYRPQFYFRTTDVTGIVSLNPGVEMVMPGDNVSVTGELISPIAMEQGLRFAVREGGKTVGSGVVTEILA